MNWSVLLIVIFIILAIGFLVQIYNSRKGDNLILQNAKFEKETTEGNRLITGSCGPGCYFQCDNAKNCPNMKLKGISPKNFTQNPVSTSPNLEKNLPLGYGSTISGPYSGNAACSGNVQGAMKLASGNRYGKLYPEGDQMYAPCIKGTNNPFD
jgi:hypothetical protein